MGTDMKYRNNLEKLQMCLRLMCLIVEKLKLINSKNECKNHTYNFMYIVDAIHIDRLTCEIEMPFYGIWILVRSKWNDTWKKAYKYVYQ